MIGGISEPNLDVKVEDNHLFVRSKREVDGRSAEIGVKEVVRSLVTIRSNINLAEGGVGLPPHIGKLTVDGTLRDDGKLVEPLDLGAGDAFGGKSLVGFLIDSFGHDGLFVCVIWASSIGVWVMMVR